MELIELLKSHPRYAEDFTPHDDVANLEPLAVRFTVDGRTFQDVRAKVDTASTTDRKIYIPALRFSTGSHTSVAVSCATTPFPGYSGF